MSLPIKKIYIDTKYKTKDSISNSHFKIELPQTLLMPDNTVFYIDDISIPHSWYSLSNGINNTFYIHISTTDSVPELNDNFAIELVSQNYNGAELASQIQTKLNARYAGFTVSFNQNKQIITIATSLSNTIFKVLTENDIKSRRNNQWLGDDYDSTKPADLNTNVLKLNEGTSSYHTNLSPYVSEVIDLQPIRNIYMSSPNLGNFNIVGSRGESDIIKKVPVTSDYNYMIFNNVLQGNDFLDCSRQTLRTLEFRLSDVHGNLVPLNRSHINFSIIFDRMDVRS